MTLNKNEASTIAFTRLYLQLQGAIKDKKNFRYSEMERRDVARINIEKVTTPAFKENENNRGLGGRMIQYAHSNHSLETRSPPLK